MGSEVVHCNLSTMVAPFDRILARTHRVERNSSYSGHVAFASFAGIRIFRYPVGTMPVCTDVPTSTVVLPGSSCAVSKIPSIPRCAALVGSVLFPKEIRARCRHKLLETCKRESWNDIPLFIGISFFEHTITCRYFRPSGMSCG